MPDYSPDPQVVPYLLYEDAGAAMDWLIRAFGFTERARDQQSDGTVRHGELLTGNGGVIMLGSPGAGFRGPAKLGEVTQLFEIEKSFRMSKHDLQARPIYHHQRDSIEAHLTVVFAALAVSRWIEAQTGWSIRKFVRTARRCRTIEIEAGDHTITAADPLPDDLRDALDRIHHSSGAH